MIFIAALVMIIISFFGQSNLEKANKALRDKHTIKEKSEAIAESNVALTEENVRLKNIINTKDSQIVMLQEEMDKKQKTIDTYNTLISAYAYYANGDAAKAEELLSQIDYEALEGDSKVLYTQIKEKNERLELHNELMSAYIYYSNRDYKNAKAILNNMDYDALDSGAKLLYTKISKEMK